jgi:hypothetical protein
MNHFFKVNVYFTLLGFFEVALRGFVVIKFAWVVVPIGFSSYLNDLAPCEVVDYGILSMSISITGFLTPFKSKPIGFTFLSFC